MTSHSVHRRWATLLAVCFVLAAAPSGAAVDNPQAAFEGFDAWVEEMMAEWLVPALGVSVVYEGEVVLSKGYGERDRQAELAADADTLFAIGSNSKSFTATILGMLVDEGKLDWDTPVREYMPDFRMHDPVATAGMTARDLVSHTSGLPRHDALWYASGLSRDELYDRLRYLEPSKPFRSTFQYQNLMFMTAGVLAERITGKTWEELVRERIFEPLGMKRSNFSVEDMAADANHAKAYNDKDRVIFEIPFRNIDEIGPAGSINSSAAMMARYVQFHLDHGKVGEEQLLSEANARTMQSPQMVMTGPIAATMSDPELGTPSYGLGLMVSSYRGRPHVRHGGGIDGFISAMEWLPQDKIGVVVLSNTSGSGTVPQLVVRNVFDRLLGMEPVDWAGRARKQRKEAEEMAAKAEADAEADRKKNTRPSHALADYVGSFEHPGYGRVDIALDGEQLKLQVHGMTAALEHHHYDIFTTPDDITDPTSVAIASTKVRFDYNDTGDIDRAMIRLEPAVPAIVFERVAEEAMKERAFLEKLVGEYELAGQLGTVELTAADRLTLTVTGQPTYTLEPQQGTTFALQGMEGFSVEFELAEGQDQASAVTFRQPNGTFKANRK